MERLKNNDTLTKLGDFYHYLLVLKSCLEMVPDEKIFVETYGDLSRVSKHNSSQTEIKHHKDTHILSDRSSEFWNTLKNWLENHEDMEQFKSLILLTTSSIKSNSVFNNWEDTSVNERLQIIKSAGVERKKKEKEFRKLYEIIDSYPESILCKILEKITLVFDQPNINTIRKELMLHPHFLNLSEENFTPYVNSILGYIISIPESPPYSWEIDFQSFRDLAINLRDRFTSNERVIPNTYATRTTDTYEAYKHKKFVKEIERIEYESFINDAIDDVWRKNNTIIDFFDGNIQFFSDLKVYKNDLRRKLTYMKNDIELDCPNQERRTLIKHSKKYYNKAMMMSPESFGIIKSNSSFFQCGIIHEIVDDNLICWYLEDEE
ncbi:hypothetical protein [Bacillus toyonensis]